MVFDENEIKNEIKLRQIMLKYNQDDPLIHIYMVYNLFETYKKHNLQIPDEMKDYITKYIDKANKEFPKKLEKLKEKLNHRIVHKASYNKPTEDKKTNKVEEKNKKNSLFPEGYFS